MTTTISIDNDAVAEFSDNVQYLWCATTIPILNAPPTSFIFQRDYVSLSRPCIIQNTIKVSKNKSIEHTQVEQQKQISQEPQQPKQKLKVDDSDSNCLVNEMQEQDQDQQHQKSQHFSLTLDDLNTLHANHEIIVDVTPDGYGDCIRNVRRQVVPIVVNDDKQEQIQIQIQPQQDNMSKEYFVKPYECKMKLQQFTKQLRQCSSRSHRTLIDTSIHEQQQQHEESNISEHSTSYHNEVFDGILQDSATTTTTCTDKNTNNTTHDDTTTTTNVCNNNNNNNNGGVYYYSRQNDCLRTELKDLWDTSPLLSPVHIPRTIHWAAKAFTTACTSTFQGDVEQDDEVQENEEDDVFLQPDAINLWIGNECVVSSLHKDHYENLFYVASGTKVFTLYPPADAILLKECNYPSGTFCHHQYTNNNNHNNTTSCNNSSSTATSTNGQQQWFVKIDSDIDNNTTDYDTTTSATTNGNNNNKFVRWIPDPNIITTTCNSINSTCTNTSSDYKLHPITVHVHAGEMLYLPSLWYHQVTQTCETVAINYWYDMKFHSPLWCYYRLIQQLHITTTRQTKTHE